MAARGLNDAKRLPNYPYRDDMILIWDSISAWVSEYVSLWYKSDAEVRADYEVQAWANDINTTGKVLDFCRPGGGVAGRDDLIDMCTMIIFTAGPQHAAVNFPQGTDMVFIPANPMAGYAPPPKGTGHTEQDFLRILPPMDVAVQSWSILTLLAGINHTRLGNYRNAFLFYPTVELQRARFATRLEQVERRIVEANKVRKQLFGLEYIHLLPSNIPASINI